jgi:hypothetical protein
MNYNKKLLFDALSSLSDIIGGVQIKFYSWKLISYFKNENKVDEIEKNQTITTAQGNSSRVELEGQGEQRRFRRLASQPLKPTI